jgi:hypothetical protein
VSHSAQCFAGWRIREMALYSARAGALASVAPEARPAGGGGGGRPRSSDVSGRSFPIRARSLRQLAQRQATRSELGAHVDRLFALRCWLRGSAGLSTHDWVSDLTLATGFQTLPGASFIVNGATPILASVRGCSA